MLLAVLYAFSDEAHQWFIAERSVELIDLLIDGIGATMGSAVYLSVFQAWRLQKSRNS
jgi:VanZ family protein